MLKKKIIFYFQDGDSRTTDHVTVKEEDLPSKCINIKFVDWVARRPSKTKKTSTDGIPDGYVRWKGKIVRNYKTFRKVYGILFLTS